MLMRTVTSFFADERGVTAIEYGMIAAGVFLAIVPPVAVIADGMDTTYQRILQYFTDIGG